MIVQGLVMTPRPMATPMAAGPRIPSRSPSLTTTADPSPQGRRLDEMMPKRSEGKET